jgi:hypothetical protein
LKPRPQPTEREDDERPLSLEELHEGITILEDAYEKEADIDPFPVAEKPTWLELEGGNDETGRLRDSTRDTPDLEQMKRMEEWQREADAYFERTNKGVIDIAEVLDRPYFGSMDEPDDYKKKFYAMSNYEGRKDELLEYTT